MDTNKWQGTCGTRTTPSRTRSAVTLIELLVVVSIISLLMSILFPALNRAREASRQTTCAANLRQFGIGMTACAQRNKTLCTGAFDWQRDGCVTEVGWVADLVKEGTPVGKMLCPSNPSQISRTYEDLLNLDASAFDDCVDRLGSPNSTEPDGTIVRNPCRAIVELNLAPGSEARRLLVEQQVFDKHFNTNYAASWWLVRSGLRLDASGNVTTDKPGCAPSPLARRSTLGPLSQARADTSVMSASFIPLLGCGAASKPLSMPIGTAVSGVPTAAGMTAGPVTNPGMTVPSFASGTVQGGTDGWYAGWKATRQDYRNFGPVHRGSCNLLFADGSVRPVSDENRDGSLNNGFQPTTENGFQSDKIELPADDVLSAWSMR